MNDTDSKFKEHLEKSLCFPDDITGYCVAIVGTKRSAYLLSDLSTTYKEDNALILQKKEATELMISLLPERRLLWKYARLVPYIQGVGLPTISGYTCSQ